MLSDLVNIRLTNGSLSVIVISEIMLIMQNRNQFENIPQETASGAKATEMYI